MTTVVNLKSDKTNGSELKAGEVVSMREFKTRYGEAAWTSLQAEFTGLKAKHVWTGYGRDNRTDPPRLYPIRYPGCNMKFTSYEKLKVGIKDFQQLGCQVVVVPQIGMPSYKNAKIELRWTCTIVDEDGKKPLYIIFIPESVDPGVEQFRTILDNLRH